MGFSCRKSPSFRAKTFPCSFAARNPPRISAGSGGVAVARKRPPPARLSKAFWDKRLCRPMQRRRTAHVFYSGHSGFPTRLDTSAQAGILKGAPEALRYQASCATRACLISRPARVCSETPVRSIWRSPSPAAWRLLAGRGTPRAPYQFMSKRLYAYAAGPWLGGRACLAALAGCGFPPSNRQVLPFLHTLTPCRPAGHFRRARRGSLPACRLPAGGNPTCIIYFTQLHPCELLYLQACRCPGGFLDGPALRFRAIYAGLRACHRP